MTTLEDLLKIVVALPGRAPASSLPSRLEELFGDLRAAEPARPPKQAEDLIWAAWADHPDPAVARRLELATRCIARREYDQSRRLLDALVLGHPQWAEAWNRRATLHYLEGRDAESFDDIRRALEIEPRHFGAVCSFAQVCLRRGERAAALLAFAAALAINPHLSDVRALVEDLRETTDTAVH